MTTAAFAPPFAFPARTFTLRAILEVFDCAFEMKRVLGAETGPISAETINRLRQAAERA